MDFRIIFDLANHAANLKMFPFFVIAHGLICCVSIREQMEAELQKSGAGSTRPHPLATWLRSLLEIYTNGLLTSLLLGESILIPLMFNEPFVLYSFIWALVFFCPFDLVFSIFRERYVKLPFAALQEMFRVTMIRDGLTHALKLFPSGYLIALIVGTMRGNGIFFLKLALSNRSIPSFWTPEAVQILRPSFGTKCCMGASALFILGKTTDLICSSEADRNMLYLGIVLFFLYFRISATIFPPTPAPTPKPKAIKEKRK